MLQNLFLTCGLNPSEQTVLLHLLHHGPSLASLIAKRINLKRPTVYAILDNLLRLGLISKQTRGSTTYFSSVAIDLIPQIFKNRARQNYTHVATAAELLANELPNIQKEATYQLANYKITALDSLDALYAQLEAALLGGSFAAIFNPQRNFVRPEARQVSLRFLKKTALTQPPIREIIVAGEMADWYKSHIENPHHQIKEISADKQVFSDMIFLDGSVVLTHYEKNNEVSIKITHQEFYQSMKTVFEMLWLSIVKDI